MVGMTGSGKTGLGVALMDEALLSGVPVLLLDPTGDMGNLLLNFPDLRPAGRVRPEVGILKGTPHVYPKSKEQHCTSTNRISGRA